MTDDFQSLSNEIANDFIQSIVFIDDKAYSTGEDQNHEFDAHAITKAFSKDKKICAIYKPESKSDIRMFSQIAEKADVTVIDWQIILSEHNIPVESLEEDDNDEIKGIYTKKIISDLLSSQSNQNSLKLIIIYTGDSNLTEIAIEINEHIKQSGIKKFTIDEGDPCCVFSNSCRILVVTKSNGGAGRQKHNPSMIKNEVTYDELPKYISTEFTKMTNGLLSNFALQSLTVIRKNFHQILNIFSKELDTAYLTHQSLLQTTDDANELLVELLGDTFTSILRYQNIHTSIDASVLDSWVNKKITNEDKYILNKDGTKTVAMYKRDKELILKLLKSNQDVKEKFKIALNASVTGEFPGFNNYIKKHALTIFSDEANHKEINNNFAILCHHKNLVLHDNYLPNLSLGTVVKSTSDGKGYYVCIQQRCDSIRMPKMGSRRFLFLPLSVVDDGSAFDFLTLSGDKLRLEKGDNGIKTFGLRTVKFSGSKDLLVKARKKIGRLFFYPHHFSKKIPEKFEFIFELKDLYAQRIVADYSASLSRVGLDEPEWVRLNRSI